MGDNDSRQVDDKDGDVTEGLNGRTTSCVSVASSQASKSSRLPDYDFGEDDTPKNRQNEKNKQKDNKTKADNENSEENEKNKNKNKTVKKKKNKEDDETAVASHETSEQARKKDKKPKTSGLNFFPDKKAVKKQNEVKKDKQSGDDEERPKKKSKKAKVVVVDDEVISSQNRLGSRKEPLIYNCCLCCSLGAGTLIGGIVFTILCIAYLAVRAKEFQIRTVSGVWNGDHRLSDIWRVLLIFGFITASLCLAASLLLVVASCLCGSKEKYSKIRLVISFWFVVSVTSLINNVGEAIFIEAMPELNFKKHSPSDSFKDIKSNNLQLWVLTGLFAVFFKYISLVLVSYLRLLKYMDSPKIGITLLNQEDGKIGGAKSVGRADSAKLESEKKKTKPKTGDSSVPELPRREVVTSPRRRSVAHDPIYENTNPGSSGPEKKESFIDVVNELTDDPTIFDNIGKPKPLRRIPMRRNPLPPPRGEAIYMNQTNVSDTPGAPYAKVSKPLKRSSSFSGPAVYDLPPDEPKTDNGKDQKNAYPKESDGSHDTGFNSKSSVTSSVNEQEADIEQMERLADELRRKQEELDKSGNCDSATAENLTQMALNALKLSEKILHDVKTNGGPSVTAEKRPMTEENVKLAEEFFEELENDPTSLSSNPVEEMFRMYGKDLCNRNPEMVNRYLMSYKALQEHKSARQMSMPPETGIETIATHEQLPWHSIMNPSEAVPSRPHPASFSDQPHLGFNHATPAMSQPFHSLSHAQSGPPPANRFFPIDYPMQNSASYNAEPPNTSVDNRKHFHNNDAHSNLMNGHDFHSAHNLTYPYSGKTFDEYSFESECPYSCCYSYDDYGPMFDDYGSYPPNYFSDPRNGDFMYSGPNWFPMGDPTYSMDPHHNPYQAWNEPAPPYTEQSSNRSRQSSRETKSRTTSRAKSGDSGRSSERASRRDSFRSRSLPSLLNEDLYSEASTFQRKSSRSSTTTSVWDDDKQRSRSRPTSRESSTTDITTKEAFMKGYKTALKEALRTISATRREPPTSDDDILEKLVSEVGSNRIPSEMPRTVSSDSRLSNPKPHKEDWSIGTRPGRGTSRSSDRTLRRSQSAEPSGRTSRKTSKLSFRPSSRPGQMIFDDFYDDYRSTSSMQLESDQVDEFGFFRKDSSRSSAGFKRQPSNDPAALESVPDAATSLAGRPSTRSRLSRRHSQPEKGERMEESDASYPFSESERHVYNKLNLDRPRTASPFRERGRERIRSRNSTASRDSSIPRNGSKNVLWYTGDSFDDDRFDYEKSWNDDSSSYPPHTSSSLPHQPRLDSTTSSKRKSVTFGRRAILNQVGGRR